ncbi:hypothetical protein EWB00_004767 [Schistosoma japonicum]|uniref:Uncharacterized protein n=1 Tax=Schistosoma japonicum TaxID=6182 RepID=A0A4Z2D3Z4_SCHJA|nr:hypothetical protein EWB00_004767 [Schistosoma japonicum]
MIYKSRLGRSSHSLVLILSIHTIELDYGHSDIVQPITVFKLCHSIVIVQVLLASFLQAITSKAHYRMEQLCMHLRTSYLHLLNQHVLQVLMALNIRLHTAGMALRKLNESSRSLEGDEDIPFNH